MKVIQRKRSGFCGKICLLIIGVALLSGFYYYQRLVPIANEIHAQYQNPNETAFNLIKKTLEMAA